MPNAVPPLSETLYHVSIMSASQLQRFSLCSLATQQLIIWSFCSFTRQHISAPCRPLTGGHAPLQHPRASEPRCPPWSRHAKTKTKTCQCCFGFGVCTDLHRLPRSRPREPGPPMQPQHLRKGTDIGAIWRESHLYLICISHSLSLSLSLPTWLAICHKRSSNLSALALGVSGTVAA